MALVSQSKFLPDRIPASSTPATWSTLWSLGTLGPALVRFSLWECQTGIRAETLPEALAAATSIPRPNILQTERSIAVLGHSGLRSSKIPSRSNLTSPPRSPTGGRLPKRPCSLSLECGCAFRAIQAADDKQNQPERARAQGGLYIRCLHNEHGRRKYDRANARRAYRRDESKLFPANVADMPAASSSALFPPNRCHQTPSATFQRASHAVRSGDHRRRSLFRLLF